MTFRAWAERSTDRATDAQSVDNEVLADYFLRNIVKKNSWNFIKDEQKNVIYLYEEKILFLFCNS